MIKDYGNGIVNTLAFVSYEDSMEISAWIDTNIDNFLIYEFQNNPDRHAIRFGKDQIFWDTSPHDIRGVEDIEKTCRPYFKKVTEHLKKLYNDDSDLFINSFWLAKQDAGGFVGPHHDSHSGMNPQFKYSVICYLNANPTDGELEFVSLGFGIKPPAGSMVSFPSQGENLDHEVKAISQERYSMLFWVTDNPDYEVKWHSDECPS